MSVTVDTNVLVYADNEADAAHSSARELLQDLAAGPAIFYLFWPALLGYLRIVTHPAILPRPLTPASAAHNVEQLIALPHVRVPGELPGFWTQYMTVSGAQTRGNDVPDVHLVALMRQHEVRVIHTRDRGFRRFDGIEARDPLA
ncbi:MAG: PIN domain-containing protein [Solirubrobacterales bacterium]|nr:PIN domain-containing protein [Solirubrobacterales bacterium]